MLRDVRSNVTDGLLGFATATGDGLHIKIGVSPSVTEKPITILGSMGASTIKSKLGLSPLADAVMDAVQGGAARVFCIPVAASTAGTIGEVTKTGDGGGSVTVQGSPNNAYALTVRFTAQGGLNTAAFVYSIDGDNFSDEITVPVTGSYEIEGTGLTIKFTEASSPDQKPSSFLVRDTYTLKTTAPSMTNGDVLGAIEKIKSFNEEFEFVHIVGGSTVELWSPPSRGRGLKSAGERGHHRPGHLRRGTAGRPYAAQPRRAAGVRVRRTVQEPGRTHAGGAGRHLREVPAGTALRGRGGTRPTHPGAERASAAGAHRGREAR